MTTTLYNPLVFQDFEYAKHKASLRDLYSRLTRKNNQLLTFDQIRQGRPILGQRDRGVQSVPLDKIVATEGRNQDFDRAFFPRHRRIKERWVRIAQAFYEQVPLPLVELLKVGEIYVVRDGIHRISVARARGQNFIDSHVIELDLSSPFDLWKRCC